MSKNNKICPRNEIKLSMGKEVSNWLSPMYIELCWLFTFSSFTILHPQLNGWENQVFFLTYFKWQLFFKKVKKLVLSGFLVCKFQNWYNVVISLYFHYVLVVGHIIINSKNKMMLNKSKNIMTYIIKTRKLLR